MEKGIIVWSCLILPSAMVGMFCGKFIRSRFRIFISGAIPWFALLGVLLYYEYFMPYQGGGASMWPIAQLFGGTVAAGSGIAACLLTMQYSTKTHDKPDTDDA